jgi:hypothetical protein
MSLWAQPPQDDRTWRNTRIASHLVHAVEWRTRLIAGALSARLISSHSDSGVWVSRPVIRYRLHM